MVQTDSQAQPGTQYNNMINYFDFHTLSGMLGIIAVFLMFFLVGNAEAYDWESGVKNTIKSVTTDESVTTERDDKGVWFITGADTASLYDVFEAMGYAVACDRLWQAEKYRRVGRGTLSEIFGSSQLEWDKTVRTLGYSDEELQEGFDALSQEVKDTYYGYVAGFNRRVEEVTADRSLLPYEFKSIGASLGIDYVPEPWTVLDILAWGVGVIRYFDGEGTTQGQIDNVALYQELSENFPETYQQMFEDLRWTNDPDADTYIKSDSSQAVAAHTKLPSAAHKNLPAFPVKGKFKGIDLKKYDFVALSKKMREKNETMIANLKKINAYVKMGSYAWVVSGSKTASGNPILYSGPQMDHFFDFSVPSIVTEGSINAGGLNISGMTIPGIPGIVVGRTPHHAWSMQVGYAHTTDYFYDDASDMTLHRTETIKVAGEDDVTLPIYRTSHGPVISTDPVISWKYSHWGIEFNLIGAYLDIARAESMDEFAAAISEVTFSQHYCYADRDGNIAYWMSGYDPVRAEGVDTRFPQAGDGTAEWPTPVTYKTLSTDRNTSRGYYAGWNSKSSATYDNSPNNIDFIFGPFQRGHVIEEYLSTHDDLTFEDVRDLALNVATTDSIKTEFLDSDFYEYGDGGNPWEFVKTDFKAAVSAEPTTARNEAIELLESWDGHFVDGGSENWAAGTDRSDAWILMNEWISQVLKLTFEDELGTDEDHVLLFNVLLHGLSGYESSITNSYDWFQNQSDSTAPQTEQDIILTALDNALDTLGSRPWGTDERGKITYTHELLGELHSLPTSYRSTYAQCVEMGEDGPVRIESMLPLGESGTILMDSDGQPVYDSNFFSMDSVYDDFEHRSFPVNE